MGLPTNPHLNPTPETQGEESGNVDEILRDLAEESLYYEDLRSQMFAASGENESSTDTAGLTVPKLRPIS